MLERPCPECGFDASTLPPEQVAPLLRANAEAWRAILVDQPAELLRRRTRSDRWSSLEYGCHVRDVYRRFQQRLALMLSQDNPLFANWDQDRTAAEDRYNIQDPNVVAAQLDDAAAILAATFSAVDGTRWDRRGRRSDGAEFTVASFGRYFIHDPIHHLHDVTTDLAQLNG